MQSLLKTASHTIATIAVAALAGGVTLDEAYAEAATIKESDFAVITEQGFNVINVYSSDGVEWDTISGPPLKFDVHGFIETKWPGLTDGYGFYLGYCNSNGCGTGTIGWKPLGGISGLQQHNPVTLNYQLTLPMNQIPTSVGGGIPVSPLGDEILGFCNAKRTLWGATIDYTYQHRVWLTMGVDTAKSWLLKSVGDFGGYVTMGDNGSVNGDFAKRDSTRVTVKCHKYESDVDYDVPVENVGYEDVKVFLSTFSDAVTHPEENTTCKKGRALIRVRTDKEGPVNLRIHTVGGNEQGEEFLQVWSSEVGSGVYEAELIRWITTDETTDIQVKAIAEKSFWEQTSSPWEHLTLECLTDDGKPGWTIPGNTEPGAPSGPTWKR